MILMITRGAPFKNFLPPIFLREGTWTLTVTSNAAEAAEEIGKVEHRWNSGRPGYGGRFLRLGRERAGSPSPAWT